MDNYEELISVIIPTFGRPFCLNRALKSLINQTYHNIEIIVVDDNADNKNQEMVKKIIDDIKDSRIKLINNKKNMGGAESRNEGIKHSLGKYIAFLDDDDEYLPSKIERQYQLFREKRNSRLALVYCYTKAVKGDQVREYRRNIVGRCIYEAMVDNIAATSQWMCKKQAIIDVGYFDDVPCKQDSNVILKLLLAGYEINRVPEVLSIYHDDGTNRISNPKKHYDRIRGEESLRDICRKNYSLIQRKERFEVEYNFAVRLMEHYASVKDKKNMYLSWKALMYHPLRKKTIRAVLVGLKKMIVGEINGFKNL